MIRRQPESRLKQLACPCGALARWLLVEECGAPHGEIDGFRIDRPITQYALSFRVDEEDTERTSNALRDLILYFCQHRQVAIKTICPQLPRVCGVDKLGIDAHGIGKRPHTALHRVAYRQLAPDLSDVHGLSLEGEGGTRCNHERAGDPRQIGGQILGDTLCEVFLILSSGREW